jgi:hypothetical protein
VERVKARVQTSIDEQDGYIIVKINLNGQITTVKIEKEDASWWPSSRNMALGMVKEKCS